MTEPTSPFTVSYHDQERKLNISVVADKLLFNGDPAGHGTLIYLSFLGPHSAVRGFLAAAATHGEIRCDAFPGARLYGSEGGRLPLVTLSKETVHGTYLGPNLLLAASERIAVVDDSPEKVYERLLHSFAFPSIPSWADWIYAKLKATNQLQPLAGKGASGAIIETTEDRLDQLVSSGVREGHLRF